MAKIKGTIHSAKDPVPVGSGDIKMLEFFLTIEDGINLMFKIFKPDSKPDMFNAVKDNVGKVIEVEYTETVRDYQGHPETNRKVSQLFVDGKPVAAGGGGRSYGKSPQEIWSIESQSRANRITELWIAGTIKPEDPLVKKLRTWLEKLGEPVPFTQAPVVAPAQQPAAKAAAASKEKTPDKDESSQDEQEGTVSFKNVGEFLTQCNKQLGVDRSGVLQILGISDTTKIADLMEAFQTVRKKVAEG